jgi:hypothetical protein
VKRREEETVLAEGRGEIDLLNPKFLASYLLLVKLGQMKEAVPIKKFSPPSMKEVLSVHPTPLYLSFKLEV